MSSSSLPVLMLEPRLSWQRGAFVAGQLFICLSLPWLAPDLEFRLRLSLGALSALIVWLGYYRLGWWGAYRLRKASWLSSGEWLLERVNGEVLIGELQDKSQRNARWMCLRWQVDKAPSIANCSLMLIRGEIDAQTWRRLQVRLLLEGRSRLAPSPTTST